MLKQSDAIVLRTYPLREADLLVTLFTREEGKIKGVARSAKKSARVTLHSTSTEWLARFHPMASGISPLTQACSERTTPQR